MPMGRIAGLTTAAFIVSVAAFAQTDTSQKSTTARNAKAGDTTTPMTVVGCLVKETDYRKAHHLGSGALGGVGLGDEFVLVDTSSASAMSSSAAATTAPAANPSTPSASAQNCTESGNGTAYRLTGQLEEKLKPFVGRRLEVTGTFDHPRDARTAAGETNAKLPAEIKISSYREAPALSASNAPATTAPTGTAGTTTPAPAKTAPATTAPANTAPATTAAPRRMPKTASNQPLFALLSLIALSAGFGVHALRRRMA